MKSIDRAEKMKNVRSDIRGALYMQALQIEGDGGSVLKLNTGNPAAFGFTMPASVTEAVHKGVDSALGYCDFRGMLTAREAICAYHSGQGIAEITAEDIFIGNGVSEVISFALTALLNPNDEVLLPSPCYPLWSNTVRLCGAKCVFYCCDENAGFQPDLADMRKKVTANTRAIVIINPNNPTGAVYEKDVLSAISDLARERGLLIFSDEIYDRLLLDDAKHIPIASLAPDVPVVTMNGLSKSHFLCGFRVGWMVLSGPSRLTESYRDALIALTSLRLCAGALAQTVIPAALADQETPKGTVKVGGRFHTQREAVTRVLDGINGISYVKNRAAFYLFPKLNMTAFRFDDDRDFAKALLHETHILVVPGSGFEHSDNAHFRIVMLPCAETLADAMIRMENFLDKYRK